MVVGLAGVAGLNGCQRGVAEENAERAAAEKASPVFSPQSQIDLIKTRPYESKGLTPVSMRTVAGLSSFVIAEGGKARTPIVIPPNSLYYSQIAQLLKEHLEKATGAVFEIVHAAPEGQAIYVGPFQSPETVPILDKAKSLPPEHFLVESFDKGVMLIGNDHDRSIDSDQELSIYDFSAAGATLYCSRGTLFAAIDFLERFVGVRWYMCGPLGLCVPDLKDTTLHMPPVAYEDGPVFSCRSPGPSGLTSEKSTRKNEPNRQDWDVWSNVFTRMGVMMPVVANHTDCFWDKYYAKDHPEYFALRPDGSRMTGETGKEMYSSQRCYTNEGGFQEHLKNIERYLSSQKDPDKFAGIDLMRVPNKSCIYWLPNDGFSGCACPECLKLTDKDAPPDRTYSRLIWSYIAKLGRAIKERWPEKKLCVLAYSTASFIPPDIKLPDNIVVSFCMTDVADCYMKEAKYRQANQERLDAIYNKMHGKVGMWIYYPACPAYENKMSIPLFAPHVQVEFFRANKDKIYGAFLCNATPESIGVNGQALYLYYKQLWNPDMDVDAYLAEFVALMYGPAASQMKDYYQTTIDRWEKIKWSYLPPPYHLSQAVPESMIWKETYPREVRDHLQKTLKEALAAAPAGSIYHARVQYLIDSTASFFEQGMFADETVKPLVDCVRLDQPPKIDGDTREWDDKTPAILRTWMGAEAAEKTEIFTAHDSRNIYIAGRVHESQGMILPPDKSKKGDLFGYDSVEIFLCADQIGLAEAGIPKSEQHYQIALNAAGTAVVYRKEIQQPYGTPLEKFNFTYAVKPMGKGFQFEMAIPYASLNSKVPAVGKSEWFVNFYRNRPRGEDKGYQAWAPTMGKPFFESSRFGILRFSTPPLYKMDFDKTDISVQDWTTVAVPKEASWHLEEGKLVVSVKALPELASDASTSVYFDKVPKLPLDKPVSVEWGFRYKGVGLKAVSLTVKSSYDEDHKRNVVMKTLQIVPVGGNATSDWQRGALKIPDGEIKLDDISYWDLGLRFAPGADFTIEIDSIRVLADESS